MPFVANIIAFGKTSMGCHVPISVRISALGSMKAQRAHWQECTVRNFTQSYDSWSDCPVGVVGSTELLVPIKPTIIILQLSYILSWTWTTVNQGCAEKVTNDIRWFVTYVWSHSVMDILQNDQPSLLSSACSLPPLSTDFPLNPNRKKLHSCMAMQQGILPAREYNNNIITVLTLLYL